MSSNVYKSQESKAVMLSLYDTQLAALNIEYEDIYVDTTFGKTHILKTGNPNGPPIVLFHGGNSTCPYHLRDFLFLREDYLLYALDTIGHPGKSAETVLSAKNLEYGRWASEVISGLALSSVTCVGSSYGGGILAKLMCVAPGKIEKAVLLVPSGICNVSTFQIALRLGIPMVFYILTKSEKWLIRSILPMAINQSEIDEETFTMVRDTFNHVTVKAGMPTNVKEKDMKQYSAPTLLITGEKDILFPGEKVIERAKTIIPTIETHLIIGSGHMNRIGMQKHVEVVNKIISFLKRN